MDSINDVINIVEDNSIPANEIHIKNNSGFTGKLTNLDKETKCEPLPKDIAFELIASRRIRAVQEALRVLSNCSNKRNYEYTQEQVEQMFKVLQMTLDATKLKFTDSLMQTTFFFKEGN